jgi:hypothetical protein
LDVADLGGKRSEPNIQLFKKGRSVESIHECLAVLAQELERSAKKWGLDEQSASGISEKSPYLSLFFRGVMLGVIKLSVSSSTKRSPGNQYTASFCYHAVKIRV